MRHAGQHPDRLGEVAERRLLDEPVQQSALLELRGGVAASGHGGRVFLVGESAHGLLTPRQAAWGGTDIGPRPPCWEPQAPGT